MDTEQDEYECTETTRYCEDYIENYGEQTITSSTKACIDLSPKDTDKNVCMFTDGKKCETYYKDCSVGDSNTCSGIKPLNDEKTGFNYNYKCNYESGACNKVPKKCSDFDKSKDDKEFCESLQAPNTNHQICLYDSTKNECNAVYKTCDSYQNVVISRTDRNAPTCNAITPRNTYTSELIIDPYSYCVLSGENNMCESKKRPCNNITDQTICNTQTFQDAPTKRCLYLTHNKTCVESYRTCEDYTATEILKDICELIEPEYTDINNLNPHHLYNCTYNIKDDGTKTCTRKKIECEDYKVRLHGDHECADLSVNIEDNDPQVFQCSLESNGKCAKGYIRCSSYKGKDKGICESIKASQDNYKCVLEHDKECKEKQKLCSEYTGDDATICNIYYTPSSSAKELKECRLVKGVCSEQYKRVASEEIHYCSDYRGNDKQVCENIKPYDETDSFEDPSAKCVYNNTYGCMREEKKCGDTISESVCLSITLKDSNKQCAFIGNRCVEQFKTCQLYQDSIEGTNKVDEDTCKAILINLKRDASISENYKTHYCKYTAGATNSDKGTCTSTERTCSDFVPTYYKDSCPTQPIGDLTKKCEYTLSGNNVICSSKSKNCSELSSLSLTGEALNAACEEAKATAGLICKAKDAGYGCIETKENGELPDPQPEPEPEPEDDTTKCPECKCSGGEKYFSKIVFALLFFLLA